MGQDVGAGKYTAVPGPGEVGNFIIINEAVDVILGGEGSLPGGVPKVTFAVQEGDVIDITNMSEVTLTPS